MSLTKQQVRLNTLLEMAEQAKAAHRALPNQPKPPRENRKRRGRPPKVHTQEELVMQKQLQNAQKRAVYHVKKLARKQVNVDKALAEFKQEQQEQQSESEDEERPAKKQKTEHVSYLSDVKPEDGVCVLCSKLNGKQVKAKCQFQWTKHIQGKSHQLNVERLKSV